MVSWDGEADSEEKLGDRVGDVDRSHFQEPPILGDVKLHILDLLYHVSFCVTRIFSPNLRLFPYMSLLCYFYQSCFSYKSCSILSKTYSYFLQNVLLFSVTLFLLS